MKVRVNAIYTYTGRGFFDQVDGHPVEPGTKVRVINLHGAPKANTMGQCYIATLDGTFLRMVQTASLER
jgi:hypothetical protein